MVGPLGLPLLSTGWVHTLPRAQFPLICPQFCLQPVFSDAMSPTGTQAVTPGPTGTQLYGTVGLGQDGESVVQDGEVASFDRSSG
jgi:hypothetical protein